MKIILSVPGHLKTVPMNHFVHETLKTMGHDVRLFNFGASGIYPKFLKKISKKSFITHQNNKLKKMIKTFKPDIFLTIFGFDHDRTIIEYIKEQRIITACWWLNDPCQFKRSILQAGYYNYYFTNASEGLDDYRKEGIKNVFFLPAAAYPPVHHKLPDAVHRFDVCFAGDWGPTLEEILTLLASEFNISIFSPWKKKIKKGSPLFSRIYLDGFFSPEDMVTIFNQSSIVLNIHGYYGTWDYGTNPRVFEANGCGAFQLSDYKKEIPKLYEPDKEIALYSSMDELKEKLTHYLAHQEKRSQISECGLLRTINCHTYEHRLSEMFSIIHHDGH